MRLVFLSHSCRFFVACEQVGPADVLFQEPYYATMKTALRKGGVIATQALLLPFPAFVSCLVPCPWAIIVSCRPHPSYLCLCLHMCCPPVLSNSCTSHPKLGKAHVFQPRVGRECILEVT